MSTELGFDYSCFVQPSITPAQAQGWYNAGLRRCGLAMDSSDATYTSAQALTAAGITLGAYRELSGPSQYQTQVQDAAKGMARLAAIQIYCDILWLTAEDTSLGTRSNRDVLGRRLIGLPRTSIAVPHDAQGILVTGLHNAVDAAGGLAVGIYTGAWVWGPYYGNSTDFAHLPLWHAGYDGNAAIEDVNYGGWKMPYAHQYASPVSVAGSVGLDLEVWTVSGEAPTPPSDPLAGLSSRVTTLEGQVATILARLANVKGDL